MKNKLEDLNNHLFEALERLNDENLTGEQLKNEIRRSDAITKIGSVIVANAAMQLKAFQYHNEESRFLPNTLLGCNHDE